MEGAKGSKTKGKGLTCKRGVRALNRQKAPSHLADDWLNVLAIEV